MTVPFRREWESGRAMWARAMVYGRVSGRTGRLEKLEQVGASGDVGTIPLLSRRWRRGEGVGGRSVPQLGEAPVDGALEERHERLAFVLGVCC